MSTTIPPTHPEDQPPEMAFLQMLTGYWLSQAIYVAARLGIADLLKDRPQTSAELASATGTHGATLYRLLRALASCGVFAEDEQKRFRLTPLAAPLQTGPGSMRALTLHLLESPTWLAWNGLLGSVQTGETAFLRVHGTEVFPYYGAHPESAQPFNQAMIEASQVVGEAVRRAYDFSVFDEIVDVGGGQGGLLTAILQGSPGLRGVLFDQEAVVEGARGRVLALGLVDRVKIVAGNFFDRVPESADAYLLKYIIHDWDDRRSLVILRNVERAMRKEGKLLLIEGVVPGGNDPSFSKLGDLHMLVMTGGRERTAQEYRQLLDRAGFKLERIVPTESPVSVLEAVKRSR
jgi:hypothetical protein